MGIQDARAGFGVGGGGAAAEVNVLPLRMLVVANFLGRRLGVAEAPGEADTTPRRVDKDDLKIALERLAPRLLFDVPNHLGGSAEELLVDQTIKRYEDFSPLAVAMAQPQCAALLKLRARIEELAGQGLTPGKIAAALENEAGALADGHSLVAAFGGSEISPAPPAGASASIPPGPNETPGGGSGAASGSVLDMIMEETTKSPSTSSPSPSASASSTASKPAAKPASALGSVISSIAGGAKKTGPKGPTGPGAPGLSWIDERLTKQLAAIMHAPEFTDVEEAWRGLWFLVARTDFRKDAILEILPCAKQDLRAILINGALENEWNTPGDPALSVVVIDHLFDRTARDMDLLAELAQSCERLQVPVIAEAGAAFFGLDSLGPLGSKASLHDVVSDPQFTKWLGFRQSEPSRWLALAVNRFLLRRPYGEEGNAVKGLASYIEPNDENHGAGLLWGSAVWALASAMMRSFAREGWPHFISGPKQGGLVEDLPLRRWEARPNVVAKIPLETGVSDMQAQDLATAGLIPLQSAANTDKAYFTYVPGAHAPKRYGDPGATQEAAMMALLPYQLYAGRVAGWLNRQLSEEAGAADGEALAARLKQKVLALLATASGPAPADCATVKVTDSPKNPDKYMVTFELKPPFKLFNLTPRLELNIELRK